MLAAKNSRKCIEARSPAAAAASARQCGRADRNELGHSRGVPSCAFAARVSASASYLLISSLKCSAANPGTIFIGMYASLRPNREQSTEWQAEQQQKKSARIEAEAQREKRRLARV